MAYSRVNGTSRVPNNLELENILSLFDPYKRHSVVFQDLNDLVHWNTNILTHTSSSSMEWCLESGIYRTSCEGAL